MTNNLVQYATIFSAYGCKFNYNSADSTLDVIDGKDASVERALKDIALFDNTANYLDGASAIPLADTIDGEKNPLSKKVRANILDALNITVDGKFVYQVLSLQKNNRSWHYSKKPRECSSFGDTCTHRGINPDPERKGRTSSRQPNEYHMPKGDGTVREQLVTPALEVIFKGMNKDRIVSGPRLGVVLDNSIKKLKRLDLDQRLEVIRQLQEV